MIASLTNYIFTTNFKRREFIALVITLAFHFFGCLGMRSNISFFYDCTPLNIIICCLLIFYTHPKHLYSFYLFASIAFCIGFIAELIGVNTSLLFGTYAYGSILGWGIGGVPFTIGLNWFVVLYCSAVISYKLLFRLRLHLANSYFHTFIFACITASIATLFDYVIEPGATKLLFWTWQNHQIPFYNYICWWVCSFVIAILFPRFVGTTINRFAIWLFIIQAIFFVALQ